MIDLLIKEINHFKMKSFKIIQIEIFMTQILIIMIGIEEVTKNYHNRDKNFRDHKIKEIIKNEL